MTSARWRTTALVAGYVLVCLIWGTNWVAIKLAVTDMPPMLASGLRFLMAAPVLMLVCRLAGKPILFARDQLHFAVFVTIAYFCLPYFLLNYAEQSISSGLTAICFSTIAILIVLLSVPILGTRIGVTELLGVLIAMAGLLALILRLDRVSATSGVAVLAALGAAGLHAFSYVLIKRDGSAIHTLTLNTLPVLVAGVLLVGMSLLVERPTAAAFTTTSIGATVHLALVASVIGLVVYFALLQRLSALTMSFVFVVFPLLAQLFSHFADGVPIGPIDAALILVIMAAMGWTLWGQQTKARIAAPWRPSESQLQTMYADAMARYPEEACGFCHAERVHLSVNQLADEARRAHSPSRRTAVTGFAFETSDLLALARSFDEDDPARLIYHSHPDAGAYLSQEDQSFAVLDRQPAFPVLHLVIDVTAEGVRGSRLFDFDSAAGRYVEVAVFGKPEPAPLEAAR